jgi:hydrogenase expression/formation protein HypC
MCLAKPLKLATVSPDNTGTIEIPGGSLTIGLDLVPDAKPGNYVLVHAGMAIELLDDSDAESILEDYKNFVDDVSLLAPGESL